MCAGSQALWQYRVNQGGAMSITRRGFLRGALAACALPAAAIAEPERPGCLSIHQVIFDARRSHALSFAETARGLGAPTQAFGGNALQLEYRDHFVRSKARGAAVAGLTDFPSLFWLQAMAADAGLHPVLRIHHGTREGMGAHEAFGAERYRAISTSRLTRCGSRWADEVARLVLNLPARELDGAPKGGNLPEANLRVLASRGMVTWVMA
jgi:hypothetical protein